MPGIWYDVVRRRAAAPAVNRTRFRGVDRGIDGDGLVWLADRNAVDTGSQRPVR
jgi:hypothetical protein